MREIVITTLDSINNKSFAGAQNLYLLTGDADCLKRAFFQALSQGWILNSLNSLGQNNITVLTSSSIDKIKDEVQSWFNPDVVKVSIG